MVFNGDAVLFSLVGILFLWIGTVSILFLRARAHYNTLTEGLTKRSLTEVLEKMLHREQESGVRTKQLEKRVEQLIQDGDLHLSRIGMVRFNPFLDTGGSQSFTLAILDGRNNGLVMTSLYARTGNRWYVKEVRGGRGEAMELSKEEIAAIAQAQTEYTKKL